MSESLDFTLPPEPRRFLQIAGGLYAVERIVTVRLGSTRHHEPSVVLLLESRGGEFVECEFTPKSEASDSPEVLQAKIVEALVDLGCVIIPVTPE